MGRPAKNTTREPAREAGVSKLDQVLITSPSVDATAPTQPTLAQFKEYVNPHEIHYFIGGGNGRGSFGGGAVGANQRRADLRPLGTARYDLIDRRHVSVGIAR